jgi:tRNA (guanosine-2'-O-)-methyltransferase
VTVKRYRRIVEMLNRRQPDLTVIMEGVHKAHNLAAIARSCDAVGIGRIHAVSEDTGVHLGHKKASGTEKWVDVRVHATIESVCQQLQDEKFTIVAACIEADAKEYDQVDYTRPTAIVVGNELDGLTVRALDAADCIIRIPVYGMVKALNVSVATALILYEAMRQRRAAGFYGQRRISDADFVRLAFKWTHPAIASYCRRNGLSYPALDRNGELLHPIGDNESSTALEFFARVEGLKNPKSV